MSLTRLVSSRRLSLVLASLFVLGIITSACSPSASGLPAAAGEYSVQKDSVRFDGDRYQLYWADNNGSLHQLETRNLQLVRDPNRTYLEVPSGGGDPVLHLPEDEPVSVQGQDRQGNFNSPWFPFLLGATLGNAFGGRGLGGGGQTIVINNPAPGERGTFDPSTPAYRYPPTGTFGRDDTLQGSLDSSRPQTPDYGKVQPSPYATVGKASGTGGGAAASNKSGSGTGLSSATSGQSGGTGSGVAASAKGGFAGGSQSYSAHGSGVGAGSGGLLGGGSSSTGGGAGSLSTRPGSSSSSGGISKPSIGKSSSGSKGIGGARAPSTGRR